MAQFQFSKLQDDRSVSTQCRQRTDLGTHAGKLYIHAAYIRVPMLKRKSQQLTYTKENGASVSAAGGGFHCHQTHNNSTTQPCNSHICKYDAD
ncbi:MAG TPA: hypothetical protein C5S51_09780 [Methanosarcinaceae archaeon]|nr:hypothetical protein [Methanosarcinaceae archaeon]